MDLGQHLFPSKPAQCCGTQDPLLVNPILFQSTVKPPEIYLYSPI